MPRPRNKPPAKVAFSHADIRRFSQAMVDMSRELKRDMPRVTQQAAVWFCQSARKATPISVKRRELEPVTEESVASEHRWMVIKGKWKYNIIKYNKQGDIVKIPTNQKDDPRRKIKMRGAAKNAWSGCIKRLFKTAPMVGTAPESLAAETSEAKRYSSGGKAVAEVANKISYIEKLDRGGPDNPPHHIMAIAYGSTERRILGSLKKAMEAQKKKFKI
jgi:hypothetical protein